MANIPGAIAGAIAGNRLGAMRDAHHRPVYEVFKEMPQVVGQNCLIFRTRREY